MTTSIDFHPRVVDALAQRLNRHPLYESIQSIEDLRVFMEQHVFPVWDFMSLLKCLQSHVAPAQVPWRPVGSGSTRHFINQIVLGEESDEVMPQAQGEPRFTSHFELYCDAMREVGANPDLALRFARTAGEQGLDAAFALPGIPAPALAFMRTTFGFIATGKPHIVGAAFSLGREEIIPEMFRALLARVGIGERDAPAFHYYLKRHIHLDEGSHGPMALRMVNEFVAGDARRLAEAEAAAREAIEARIAFWDGVLESLPRRSPALADGTRG